MDGNVVEFCISKWWANLGTIDVKYTINYHGVMPSQRDIVMHGGEGLMRLDLVSRISQEDIHPEIKLKSSVQVLRPVESRVITLGSRDILPPARHTFELQLQYSISVAKPTEITPNLPMLSDVLYESEIESQLWMLFDANKRLVGSGDAYPSKWGLKVDKGEYTLKVHIRQEKRDILDRFTETPLLLSSKLSSAALLDVYSSHAEAVVGGKKMNTAKLYPGKTVPIYISPLSSDKHTKGSALGQYLQGTATFAKDEQGKKTDIYQFKYILPEPVKKKDKGKEKDGKKVKVDDYEGFKEAVKDTKIIWLSKLPADNSQTKELYTELCTEGVSVTSVHAARLQGLTGAEPKDWNEILATADKLIGSVDQTELLAWLGTKADTRDNAGEVKKEMEKMKGQLIDALAAKGEALLKQELKVAGDRSAELLEILSTILKYCDSTDSKVIGFVVGFFIHQKMYAKALKYVVKQIEDKHSKELDLQAVDLLNKLGWTHAASFLGKSIPAKFPAEHQPF